ncbi:coxsackievirus and adenovirus receptor homolog [Poecilia reticulata]|uniref:coxsackievirus and adenovirus receptor homolog n=1 Tax=Poecilia reticulata TaxID=8081 RepID=UPI0007EADAFA|nr:PREDICTED: coxsackievirus and adenovirus receptor homolog [Poecilia reticulata]
MDPFFQHPSFRNRVDLQDRQMKAGDVSLVLKNVTTNDTGTYQCRVQNEGSLDRNIINTVILNVSASGKKNGSKGGGGNGNGSIGLLVGLPVAIIVCVVAVAAVFLYKRRSLMQKHSPAESAKPEHV